MGRSLSMVTPFAWLFGPVLGQQGCRSCIHLEIGTVVGIIAADILLTLLIALSVYFFVSRMRKKIHLKALESGPNSILSDIMANGGMCINDTIQSVAAAEKKKTVEDSASFCDIRLRKTQAMSTRKKLETESPYPESPYQELQGVQDDVYSDLRPFQK